MDLQALRELAPNGQHRVERASRVLKDHPDLRPANPLHDLLVDGQEVVLPKAHLLSGHTRASCGQESEQRQHRGGFSAAALAYERQALAPPE